MEWNRGASSFWPVCLSILDSVSKYLNLGNNFWTVRDRDFIFGNYTLPIKPFLNDIHVNEFKYNESDNL